MNSWPYEIDCFAFISVRYTIKFTEPVYETEVQTRTWNVNLYMATGISNWHIWNFHPAKMSRLHIFQFVKLLISQAPVYKPDIQSQLCNVNLDIETGISNCIFQLWPNENEGFAFISDRYTIKFTEPVYETEIQTQNWNVHFYMETGISNWHIWKFDPTKSLILPLFQFATRLNSQNQYMKLRLDTKLKRQFVFSGQNSVRIITLPANTQNWNM